MQGGPAWAALWDPRTLPSPGSARGPAYFRRAQPCPRGGETVPRRGRTWKASCSPLQNFLWALTTCPELKAAPWLDPPILLQLLAHLSSQALSPVSTQARPLASWQPCHPPRPVQMGPVSQSVQADSVFPATGRQPARPHQPRGRSQMGWGCGETTITKKTLVESPGWTGKQRAQSR